MQISWTGITKVATGQRLFLKIHLPNVLYHHNCMAELFPLEGMLLAIFTDNGQPFDSKQWYTLQINTASLKGTSASWKFPSARLKPWEFLCLKHWWNWQTPIGLNLPCPTEIFHNWFAGSCIPDQQHPISINLRSCHLLPITVEESPQQQAKCKDPFQPPYRPRDLTHHDQKRLTPQESLSDGPEPTCYIVTSPQDQLIGIIGGIWRY